MGLYDTIGETGIRTAKSYFLQYLQTQQAVDEAMKDTPEDFVIWLKRDSHRLAHHLLGEKVEELEGKLKGDKDAVRA